jgi:hypothetical protein
MKLNVLLCALLTTAVACGALEPDRHLDPLLDGNSGGQCGRVKRLAFAR